jgi:hypothetical protein
MRPNKAVDRYLKRHIEPDLPDAPGGAGPWQQVLVIPVYRESPRLLDTLRDLDAGGDDILVLLILNRPDRDQDDTANDELRQACHRLGQNPALLNEHTWLYLHDLEQLQGPTPAAQGVGLARKTGCDIAITWRQQQAIQSEWIHCTDADAHLPPDYFQHRPGRDTVALSLPFHHLPGSDTACNRATALYELRLHHYVLGLEHAGSPYAFHTIGSCIAIRAEAYTQVHGFPRRSGAEDFYLLNKLAKLGSVETPAGNCIELLSRPSTRVPFGTGPAVAEIMLADDPKAVPLFYHPDCFEALRAVLAAVPALQNHSIEHLDNLLAEAGLREELAASSTVLLRDAGLPAAIDHCRRHSRERDQFLRHFQQWFDGFRTLKFVRGLRVAWLADLSFRELRQSPPPFWPDGEGSEPQDLLHRVQQLKGWR